MIPDEKTIRMLWDTYRLPPDKRIHSEAVAKVALTVAKKINTVMLDSTRPSKPIREVGIWHLEDSGAEVGMTKKKGMTRGQTVNEYLLLASALLHDIDKNIEKHEGECHPDTAVRVLRLEGMSEVAEVIRTHPLHMILQPDTAPQTIEQKLLFLADKMTKYEYIGVDKRFDIWRKEDLDEQSQAVLQEAYPKVRELKDEILNAAGITEKELVKLVK